MRLWVLSAVVVVGVWIVAWSVSVREDPPDSQPADRTPSERTPIPRETAPAPSTEDWAQRLVTPSGGISNEGVGEIVRGGRPAFEALGALLAHEDERVRNAALDALGQLGPAARDLGPRVVEVMLEDPNEFVRLHALSTTVKIGGNSVIRRIVAALSEPREPERRLLALQALKHFGPDAREHVSALIPLLEDRAAVVRGFAMSALRRLGGEIALAALLEFALDPERDDIERSLAVEAIGGMGAAARSAVEPLASLLPEAPDRTARAIPKSLAWIGGERALDLLVEWARDPDADDLRARALSGLGAMGAGARPAVPVLLDLMTDESLGREAQGALTRIAGALEIAALATMLCQDPEAARRRCAAETLGMIGSPASSSVAALISALTDADGRVRRWSAWALGRVGPSAASALPALRLASKGTDERMRAVARRAIARIVAD